MKKYKFYTDFLRLCLVVFGLLFYSEGYSQSVYNKGDTIYIPDGVTLYINGDLKNADNGSNYPYIRNEGSIILTGDLTKSVNTIYTGNDSMILSGSSVQNLAGLTYWYLGITGGASKNLTGDALIKNKIKFTSGYLNTGVHTLFLDSQAILIEDSADYVIGKASMTKYLSRGVNYTFGGLGLEIKADSFSPGLTKVIRTTGDYLTGNGYQSINRYFEISPDSNGRTGSTVVMHYYDGELNSLAENDLGIYRKTNYATWEYDGYIARDAGANTITASLDTLGKITAGSITFPLPVELLSFEASLYNSQTSRLDWNTASEINNDHFDIERSFDGNSFAKVGEVKGNGTTNKITDYHYLDIFGLISHNILYYRLKQVDYNGGYKYSDIRAVRLSDKEDELKVWYNAATDRAEARIYNEKETKTVLRMTDTNGKLLVEQEVTLPEGSSHLQLNMFGLAKATYFLSVIRQGDMQVKKLLKY